MANWSCQWNKMKNTRSNQNLEQYCEKIGFDFLTVKDIFEDRIDRKFVSECQLLRDDRARRRFELERLYGVDFSGMFGKGDFDLV